MSSSKSINLPLTEFPMRANLPKREPGLIEYWHSEKFQREMAHAQDQRESFVLHDGPPYANGIIHLGHALNKTLKDAINKVALLHNKKVHFVPGWDCHGLPIEIVVEKKYGNVRKLGKKEFIQKCREVANGFVEKQKADFIRLGVLAHWDEAYLTMDPKFEGNAIRALAEIFQQGYLVQAFKPVHWCTKCQSALAEAEAEYREMQSTAIDVLYPLAKGSFENLFKAHIANSDTELQAAFVVWTTTPWTLPSSRGLAVHEEMDYDVLELSKEAAINAEDGSTIRRLIIAHKLRQSVLERAGVSTKDWVHTGTIKGKELTEVKAIHPYLENRVVPVFNASYVTAEQGSGIVHTAPAHGLDDWNSGRRVGLQVDDFIDARGIFRPGVEVVEGLPISAATQQIVDLLRQRGRLLLSETYTHSYPHCWRHGEPLIFRATPQWFIELSRPVATAHQGNTSNEGVIATALKMVDGVKFEPESGRDRFRAMLTERPDWCVSRQRTWGLPIPVLLHRETGKVHPKSHLLMQKLAAEVDVGGVEVWQDFNAHRCLDADAEEWEKSADVMDVWFDSGVTHACVLDRRPSLHSPADLYLEGTDQHRGWFQSSMLTSTILKNEAPYRQVLTHSFLIDTDGEKMSKSRGNVTTPQSVFDKYGADVLRLWALSSDFRTEMTVSEDIMRQTADNYRRLRNTMRYILGNAAGLTQAQMVKPADMVDLDKWILRESALFYEEVLQDFAEYKMHLVVQKLVRFTTVRLSNFYFDVIKDRLYTLPKNTLARRSAQTTLYYLGQYLVRLYAPILSFTAEEVWQSMKSEWPIGEMAESVFCAVASDASESLKLAEPTIDWPVILRVRDAVNEALEAARSTGEIKVGLQASVTIKTTPQNVDTLLKLGHELRYTLLVSEVKLSAYENPEGLEEFAVTITSLADNKDARQKCERCWHYEEEGKDWPGEGNICPRCQHHVKVIDGEEEVETIDEFVRRIV